MKLSSKTKGIICIIASAFFFSTMSMFVRLSGDLPSVQKCFFRNFVALIFAVIILLRSDEKFKFDKSNLRYLILRASLGTMGLLCNFYAIDHMVLSDASMLNKLSPFFAILFSYFLLKEKISLFQAFAVVIAFIGMLFIVKPGSAGFSELFPAIVGVIGGLGAGIAYTMVRILGKRGERGSFIVFFFSAFSCLITLPIMMSSYAPMSWVQTLCLLGAGLAACGGQFTITAAYSHCPAKEISVYDYLNVVFSAFWGLTIFGQIPDFYSVIGYIIICGISVVMFFYNQKHD